MIWIVYKITNSITNLSYIWLTYQGLEIRFRNHIKDRKRHWHRKLYKAMNEYWIKSFTITELWKYSRWTAEEMEIFFIKKYNTFQQWYNETLWGNGKKLFNILDKDIIEKYYELTSIKQTALFFKCSIDFISEVLEKNCIKKDLHINKEKKIICNELNKEFYNIRECILFFEEKYWYGYSNIERSIYRVLDWTRKKYRWFTFKQT